MRTYTCVANPKRDRPAYHTLSLKEKEMCQEARNPYVREIIFAEDETEIKV